MARIVTSVAQIESRAERAERLLECRAECECNRLEREDFTRSEARAIMSAMEHDERALQAEQRAESRRLESWEREEDRRAEYELRRFTRMLRTAVAFNWSSRRSRLLRMARAKRAEYARAYRRTSVYVVRPGTGAGSPACQPSASIPSASIPKPRMPITGYSSEYSSDFSIADYTASSRGSSMEERVMDKHDLELLDEEQRAELKLTMFGVNARNRPTHATMTAAALCSCLETAPGFMPRAEYSIEKCEVRIQTGTASTRTVREMMHLGKPGKPEHKSASPELKF